MRPIQRQRILDLLSSRSGQWVPLPQLLDLRISQFGARILELRREGYQIENRTESVKDLFGSTVRHSSYRLLSAEPKEVTI